MDVFVGVMGIGVNVDVTVYVGVRGGTVMVSVGDGSDVSVEVGGCTVLVGGPNDGVSSDPVCGMIGTLQANASNRITGRTKRRETNERWFIHHLPV